VRSGSNDTRLLVAGVVAAVALVAYLAVAFANTHASRSVVVSAASKVAPWTPYGSTLVPIPLRTKDKYVVRVIPVAAEARALGSYGALAPTLVPEPTPGTTFVVGLGLKEARQGRIGIQIHEFRSGTPSRYLVDTTVPVTAKWRRFRFRVRVKGSWVGLSMYVYRPASAGVKPRFAIRGLTVNLR
jgi:hypothetical protein